MYRERIDYIDNAEFTQAIIDWIKEYKNSIQNNSEIPELSEYIGDCFIQIAYGLSVRNNFKNYTFLDEMIQDAILACVDGIYKFDPLRATNGRPNAFAYFTTVCINAFVARINKEKRQWHYIEKAAAGEVES